MESIRRMVQSIRRLESNFSRCVICVKTLDSIHPRHARRVAPDVNQLHTHTWGYNLRARRIYMQYASGSVKPHTVNFFLAVSVGLESSDVRWILFHREGERDRGERRDAADTPRQASKLHPEPSNFCMCYVTRCQAFAVFNSWS